MTNQEALKQPPFNLTDAEIEKVGKDMATLARYCSIKYMEEGPVALAMYSVCHGFAEGIRFTAGRNPQPPVATITE